MKSIKIQALFLVLLLLSATGCKEKIETPFSGKDNRLLELSLTDSKGHKYTASLIDENVFQIEVPSDADLSSAKVAYRISDQAQILPKPTEIDNWNNDQAFQVRSYSGEHRTYLVKIARSFTEAPNSVKLVTDDDIKAFVAKGVRHVEGHLIIGATTGTDSISNIDALTTLEKVDYNIIINPTYKGKDLSGLRNVKEVGSIILQSDKLQNGTFRHLKKVYGDIVISGASLNEVAFPELIALDGQLKATKAMVRELSLPSVEEIGSIQLEECGLLSTLTARQLKKINGDWRLKNLAKLSTVTTPKLEVISGNLKFETLKVLGVLSLNKLQSVADIEMSGVAISQFYLSELKECGKLSINATSLSALIVPHLESIHGDFILNGCGLSDLNQFGVKTIDGKLEFTNLSKLQDITAFANQLKKVASVSLVDINAGGVWDFSNTGIEGIMLERCRNVEDLILPKVMKKVEIKGDAMMQVKQLLKMSGVEEVSEIFKVSNYHLAEPQEVQIMLTKAGDITMDCSNMLSLNFPLLEEAKKIDYNYSSSAFDGRNKEIQAQCAMKKLVAPKLQSVEKMSFNLHDLEMLDMPQLKTISDELVIQCYWPKNANNVLTNLNGLSALEKVKSVAFTHLKAFNDYSFLKNAVANGSLSKLNIRGSLYQPSLDDLKNGNFIQD